MTRFDGLTALSCVLCLAFGIHHSFGEDETQEPPITYDVKLDNQTVSFKEGETTEIPGMFTNPKVTITPRQSRVFSYQGIHFRYPRSFVFHADLAEPLVKIWTLTGNQVKITINVMQLKTTTAQFAEIIRKKLGRNLSQITNDNAEILLGAETLQGTSMQLYLGNVQAKMAMHIYQLPSARHQSKFLLITETMDKDGTHSQEYSDILAGLKTSFVVTPDLEVPRDFPDADTTTPE